MSGSEPGKISGLKLTIFPGLKQVVTNLEKSQVETEKLASQVHFKPVKVIVCN